MEKEEQAAKELAPPPKEYVPIPETPVIVPETSDPTVTFVMASNTENWADDVPAPTLPNQPAPAAAAAGVAVAPAAVPVAVNPAAPFTPSNEWSAVS